MAAEEKEIKKNTQEVMTPSILLEVFNQLKYIFEGYFYKFFLFLFLYHKFA
jgi:hypothetical protein